MISYLESYQGHGGQIDAGQLNLRDTAISFCVFRGLNKAERWFTVDGVVFKDTKTKVSLNQYANDQTSQGELTAPVPGKVVAVKANAGETIKTGAVVLVLESMKLEFEVKADRDGEVAQVHVVPGTQVSAGDTLVSWHVD
jgi:biotin carboxyl carrier protein